MEGCRRTERKSEKMTGEKSKLSVSVAERQHLSCVSGTCFCLLLSREIWIFWSLEFKKEKDIFLVHICCGSHSVAVDCLLRAFGPRNKVI
jgi:hypothetical protein